jgi:hypothetical protein
MFTDCNETKVIVGDMFSFYIYNEDGQKLRKINIYEEHGHISSVTINHVLKHIVVKKKNYSSGHSLMNFSKTGELIGSLYLGSSEWIESAYLTSHPNGAVTLVGTKGAALLRM